VVEDLVRTRGPFSLRQSARLAGDATRRFDGRILVCLFQIDGRLERAACWQETDGGIALRALSEEGLERLKAVLPLEADHSEFLERFAKDELLGRTLKVLRGKRPIRLGTVTQSLVRAVCGQLIESSRARRIERRLIRETCATDGVLYAPPEPAAFSGFAPAALQRFDLSARKAATIVRLCRTLDLERLRDVPPAGAARRLERERGLGPWSVGVIGLEGLGCYHFGLVGDLGLIKLCTALLGRRAEPEDTAELLARYGEWQGLASTYLLAGFGQGLLPVRYERTPIAA
jgi:DNA-3-methyladenine glycosylase II/AraC family transcriptional regulator of adaptative response / DNA-3-methyladenine glycosylase II